MFLFNVALRSSPATASVQTPPLSKLLQGKNLRDILPPPMLRLEDLKSFHPNDLRHTSEKVLQFLFRRLMRKWVAGDAIGNAIEAAKKLSHKHHRAYSLVNFLGEHYDSPDKVRRAMFEYYYAIEAIDSLKGEGSHANVTIKPSQFGFDLIPEIQGAPNPLAAHIQCFANMRAIVEFAKSKNQFVWIDAESIKYKDFEFAAYRELQREFGNVGLCIQANIRRTKEDLRHLLKWSRDNGSISIRLVKGIYKEDSQGEAKTAFRTVEEVDMAMKRLIDTFYGGADDGCLLVVGSHDSNILQYALDHYPGRGIKLDLALLRGVLPELFEELAQRIRDERLPITLSQYIPYGPDSVAYSIRRMRESPQMRKLFWYHLFEWYYRWRYN